MDEELSRIKALLNREKAKLFSIPMTFFPLSGLEEKEYVVRLSSGEEKILRPEDIGKLKGLLPEFLHGKLKIPVIIYITLNERCKFKVRGDIWQVRALENVLRGKITWQPNECLSEEELKLAIKTLGSLLHITFSEETPGGENEGLEE